MSNVQLYTLTLAESLTKNCGMELHREIASRAFTQALEKLITDRVRCSACSGLISCIDSFSYSLEHPRESTKKSIRAHC